MNKFDNNFGEYIYFYLVIKKKFSKTDLILDAGLESAQYFVDKVVSSNTSDQYWTNYTHLKEYNVKKHRYCVKNNQNYFTESGISVIKKKLEYLHKFNRIKKLKKVLNENI